MALKGRRTYITALRQGTTEATNNLAAQVLEDLKDETPVRTGRLRDGWELEEAVPGHPSARIVTDVLYAKHVNDGTPFMDGRHMVEKALANVEGDLRKYLRRNAR